MAEIKAAGVVFIKQKVHEMGGDAENRVLAALAPAVAERYRAALPLAWIPTEAASVIYEQASKVLYPNSPNALRQLGHDSCIQSYTTVYRLLMRAATVPFLLEQAARFWRNHHSAGEISTQRTSAHEVIVTVRNHPTMPAPVREVVAGYLAGLCELAGERHLRVQRADEDPTWRWIVSWGSS